MNGIADIDQLFQGMVNRHEIPGVVASIANKDQLLYHQAFGKMDVANNVAMPKDAIFSIASMAKPITSAAVMILSEAGELELDDPISKYLPSRKHHQVITRFNDSDGTYLAQPAHTAITIRHVLTHTSGFGYGFSNHTWQRLLQNTEEEEEDAFPLLHEPGSRWTYGMGPRIIGKVVEEITGERLDEFFSTHIFAPLHMNDTFYEIPHDKLSRWVTMHTREEGILIEQPKPDVQQPSITGDGGLFSTARDYLAFLQMFLNGGTLHHSSILSDDSIAVMTRNQIGELVVEQQPGADPAVSNAFPIGAGKDKFGLGFQITVANYELSSLRSPGSYSWSGLFNTHFWVDPQKEIAAVILMQVLPFYDEACMRAYQNFEQLIYTHLN